MNVIETMRQHFETHPKAEPADVFKFIFQSVYGCEHMISSPEKVTDFIQAEAKTLSEERSATIVPLSGEYSRIDLAFIRQGLSHVTLGKIFYASSKKKKGEAKDLIDLIETARRLASDGIFSFTTEELDIEIEKWKALGFPPIHHSLTYKNAYSPAYRVISNEYVPLIPLFVDIDLSMKDEAYELEMDEESKRVLFEIYGEKIKNKD